MLIIASYFKTIFGLELINDLIYYATCDILRIWSISNGKKVFYWL